VLNEEWEKARSAFTALVSRHPRSAYADDATYWSAYALMHQDRGAAVAEYRRFLNEYAGSSYSDDAVADLAQLQADILTPPPRNAPVARGGTVHVLTPEPSMRQAEREFRRASRMMGRLRFFPRSGFGSITGRKGESPPDEETILRIEAIHALGGENEDEKSFLTLKEIALDLSQSPPVREAALDALAEFRKHDALTVLAEVATRDTSVEFQTYAIDAIGRSDDGKKSVAVLIQVYRKLPASRSEPRAAVVYTVAEAGNEKAIEFLKDVALTGDDYDLRRDAVYYLGTIGGEKARSALYEILKKR